MRTMLVPFADAMIRPKPCDNKNIRFARLIDADDLEQLKWYALIDANDGGMRTRTRMRARVHVAWGRVVE